VADVANRVLKPGDKAGQRLLEVNHYIHLFGESVKHFFPGPAGVGQPLLP